MTHLLSRLTFGESIGRGGDLVRSAWIAKLKMVVTLVNIVDGAQTQCEQRPDPYVRSCARSVRSPFGLKRVRQSGSDIS